MHACNSIVEHPMYFDACETNIRRNYIEISTLYYYQKSWRSQLFLFWWRSWWWLWLVLLLETLMNFMVHTHAHNHTEASVLNWYWRSDLFLRSYLSQAIWYMFLIHACSPWCWKCSLLWCLYPTCKKKHCWFHYFMFWPAIIKKSFIPLTNGDLGDGYLCCCTLRI